MTSTDEGTRRLRDSLNRCCGRPWNSRPRRLRLDGRDVCSCSTDLRRGVRSYLRTGRSENRDGKRVGQGFEINFEGHTNFHVGFIDADEIRNEVKLRLLDQLDRCEEKRHAVDKERMERFGGDGPAVQRGPSRDCLADVIERLTLPAYRTW